MKHKNCPNCGAPIEYDRDKCSYCGTVYYDLSEINFDNDCPAPIFFRIRTNKFSSDETPATVLIKAIPKLDGLEFRCNYTDAVCFNDDYIHTHVRTGFNCSMDMRFEAIEQDDHSLIKIIKDNWLKED